MRESKKYLQSNRIYTKSHLSTSFFLVTFFLFLIFILPTCAVNAQEAYDQYAPIFYFEGQEECFPVDVEYHINNAILYEFLNNGNNEIDSSIDSNKLANYSSETYEFYFLDNKLGTINDDNIINDYQEKKGSYNYNIYTNVVDISLDTTVVQYWMFYAFNNGDLNRHEGDWELVQIVFNNNEPSQVMYSQHHSGQKARWDQVDKTGLHPHVYVAYGSHANYFRSYSGMIGIASDHVGSNGFILTPEQYTLVSMQNMSWLEFRGLWGEIQAEEDIFLGQSGPNGPKYRQEGMMWNTPLEWGLSLSQLDSNVLLLEWFLYNFFIIFILITIVSISIFIVKRIKQLKDKGFGKRYFSILYIDGFNLKSIGNMLFILGIIIAIFALFQPWYLVSASVNSDSYTTEGLVDIILIDGIQGISVNIPKSNGPVPLGSAMIPFSILIGIGLLITIIKTFGIQTSNVLGKSYLKQGIKLMIPIIVIIIAIIAISTMTTDIVNGEIADSEITTIFQDISSSPLGGITQKSISTADQTIEIQWGLQLGGFLLLLSGIICFIGGIIERKAAKEFF